MLLRTVSHERLQAVSLTPQLRRTPNLVLMTRTKLKEAANWLQRSLPQKPLSGIAYFCMELMLSDALPICSSGLDNVAGDQLKVASDLGLPVTEIGKL